MKKAIKLMGTISLLAVIALAFGCASAPEAKADGPIVAEMESGVIEGNIAANQGTDNPDKDGTIEEASGDMFYMMDSGSITVSVNAPSAGDYIVKIYYALPTSYGDKENNVIINGEDLGPLPFPATDGKWTAKWIQASLNEGDNTITVAHNWGYTWFDYLTIEKM